MKSNPKKYHLLVSTNDNVAISIGNLQIENSKYLKEKALRYTIWQEAVFRLSFTRYMQNS